MVANGLDKDKCACCGADNPNKKSALGKTPDKALTQPPLSFSSSTLVKASDPVSGTNETISSLQPLSSLVSKSG